MKEVVFKTGYKEGNKQYELQEHYGFGYIRNELLHNGQKADPKNVSALAGLKDIRFDDSFCMAVPFYIYSNPRTKGRGKSIFDGKTDDFDSLDEVWSQWIQAMRDGRATKYIPQDLIPKNPETGALLKPNPFDNTFIATSGGMSENASNKIDVTQPDIPHESYLSTYITALDLCLQGIISPSTIGIDVKKLDNAEAQREKEKTTLYTRGKIIDALQTTIPELINTVFKSLDTLNQVINAAVVAAGHYHGLSTLYHEEGTDGYYLILTQGEEDREVFDRVCNVISEYGIPKRSTPASLTFLEEHCSTLIAEHALQRLANTSM